LEAATCGKSPTIAIILWIRQRVYQALSFCQTGPEIIDSCAAALQRRYTSLDPHTFINAMRALTMAEPHTSYRTPLSLEAGILALFEALRGTVPILESNSVARPEPKEPLSTPKNVVVCGGGESRLEPPAIEHILSSCDAVIELVSNTKTIAKRRAPSCPKTN